MSGARETQKRIVRAENRKAELASWIETLEAVRAELLVSLPPDNDHRPAAHRHRAAIRQVERGYDDGELCITDPVLAAGFRAGNLGMAGARDELERLEAQLEAMGDSLPSSSATEAALARAAEMAATADRLGGDFREGWAVLLDALTDAEAAARQVAEARDAQRRTLNEIDKLRDAFDLEDVGARSVRVDHTDEELARTLANLVSTVIAGGSIDLGLASRLDRLRGEDKAA